MKKNQKRILKIILPLVLLIVIVITIVIVKDKDMPVVGLRLQNAETDKGAKLVCEVRNRSDEIIHFEEYNIAKGIVSRAVGELGIEEVYLITEDKEFQLSPGEVYHKEFVLEDLESGHYEAEVTTKCKEGTKITVSIQFDVP